VPVANGFDNVLADLPSSSLVIDQLLIERLKFHTLVPIRIPTWPERCRLNQNEVLERPGRCLCTGAYLMPNWAALHEDDWMVAVLACDGCGQANYKAGLGSPYDLLETVR
jgi:hypothetical protein